MNPVAFQIGNFEVRWYGILIAFGVIVAILLAGYNCKKKDANFDTILDVFFVAFPAAVVGARMYYVAFEFQNYKDNNCT